MALLELQDLTVRYGEIEAVRGLSLAVDAGEVVTLLDSNGAGKSTTLKAISGLVRPAGGEIPFEGPVDPRPQARGDRAPGDCACAGRAPCLSRSDDA